MSRSFLGISRIALLLSTVMAFPAMAGDITGALRESTPAGACDATTEGAVRYVDASNRLELCDDAAWVAIANGGVSSIDGLSDGIATATSVYLGTGSGISATGGSNTAVGLNSLGGSSFTGVENVAIGTDAGDVAAAADNNVFIGQNSGGSVTGGDNNVIVGTDSAPTLTNGSQNVVIGSAADVTTSSFNNAIVIGYGASGTASNRIVLGNTSIASIYAQVTSITGISDKRLKKDIVPLGDDLGMDFIGKLRPVSYRYNNGDDTLRYGFIAQDTEEALPSALKAMIETTTAPQKGIALLNRENNEDRTYRMNYSEIIAPLVKAAQNQQAEIDALKAEIEALKAAKQ